MTDNWQTVLAKAGYPTQCVTLDFETFWTQSYSLRKMSTIEYIEHPEFEITGVGLFEFHQPRLPYIKPQSCFWGAPEVAWRIKRLQEEYGQNLEKCTLIVHNCFFDCTILYRKFGIHPAHIIDTKWLANYMDSRASSSLADLAKRYKLETLKGDTKQFLNQHWEDMDQGAMARYGNNDVELETSLFMRLLPKLTNIKMELALMQHTFRIYAKPTVKFDFKLAHQLVKEMEYEKQRTISKTGYTEKEISGDISFAAILYETLPPGETVPTKAGKPTKNMVAYTGEGLIPALAKNDDGTRILLNHGDKKIRTLMQARLDASSWPGHIKRVRSMAKQAVLCDGCLPIPLVYYGGRTGRASGTEKINPQNFGGKGRGKSLHPLIGKVRNLLVAPRDTRLIIADSAQIEARMLAYLAGEKKLVQGFANGEDVYSEFASNLFGVKVYKNSGDKDTDVKRGFGKDAILGCIAYGNKVVVKTPNGMIRNKLIERVCLEDKLWDGEQWVSHEGVVSRGQKWCVNVNGMWLTPEHEILLADGWTTAAELSMSSRKSERYTDNWRLLRYSTGCRAELSPSNAVAPVVERLLRQETIWSQENLHAVMSVLKRHPVKLRAIRRLLKNRISLAFLIEFVQLLAVARQSHTNAMVKEVLECSPVGSQIESLFLNIWRDYQDMIIKGLKSTASITTKDMSLVISDLLPEARILETADIMYAGKNKRFQCEGFMVSNCGYGMGGSKFYIRCLENDDLRPLIDDGTYDFDFMDKLVKTYRQTYRCIPRLWGNVEKAFRWVLKYPNEVVNLRDKGCPVDIIFRADESTIHIALPSGRELHYYHCQLKKEGDYTSIREHYGWLWGGAIVENIVQAISRDILMHHLLIIDKTYPVVLHVHDETVAIGPEEKADKALEFCINTMRKPPEWAPGLPLDAEGSVEKVYCK